jgi:hypothetical protein
VFLKGTRFNKPCSSNSWFIKIGSLEIGFIEIGSSKIWFVEIGSLEIVFGQCPFAKNYICFGQARQANVATAVLKWRYLIVLYLYQSGFLHEKFFPVSAQLMQTLRF